jgi:hypothetical protein
LEYIDSNSDLVRLFFDAVVKEHGLCCKCDDGKTQMKVEMSRVETKGNERSGTGQHGMEVAIGNSEC